jgi:prepilin-type N-terminal cleavage/methylation domain-containing protein
MNIFKNKKGFTLIELLIVITIIGILAVAFLPSLMGSPAKARDVQRMADVKKIAGYLANIYYTTGSLPTTLGSGTGGDNGCILDTYVNGIANSFGGKAPADPKQSTTFCASAAWNGYFVYKFGSGDYAFSVVALVEVPAVNGNSTTSTSSTLVTPSSSTSYFVVLVQK